MKKERDGNILVKLRYISLTNGKLLIKRESIFYDDPT